MIFYHWLFNHGFKFQDFVYNARHDLTMLCLTISNIGITTVKDVDYRCIIHGVKKFEAINLLEISLLENRGYIQNQNMSDFTTPTVKVKNAKHLKQDKQIINANSVAS